MIHTKTHKIRTVIKPIAAVITAALAFGCSMTAEQEPPVARISGADTAVIGSVVQLDGSESEDPNGIPLSYFWSFIELPANSSALFNNASLVNPSFVPDSAGTFGIRLVVSNGITVSQPDTFTVEVSECGGSTPVAMIEVVEPVSAGPGSDLTAPDIAPGRTVVLDASSSYDPDDFCLPEPQDLGYAWTLLSTPPGSSATLSRETTVNCSFVVDAAGTYVVSLEVTDGLHEDTTTLTVTADPAEALVPASGFEVESVGGGGWLWSGPEGIAVDSSGNIYVAQNGSATITVTDPGTGQTQIFATGLWLNGIHDLVFDPGRTCLWVTDETDDAVVMVTVPGGIQVLWSNPHQVENPSGIALFVSEDTNEYLAVIDRVNRSIVQFDPDDAAPAGIVATLPLEPPLLDSPWDICAESSGGSDYYWATGSAAGELRRRIEPAGTLLTQTDMLSEPKGIVRVTTTDAVVVADSGSGRIMMIENCGAPPCRVTPLLSGLEEPWGVVLEDSENLLITDRAANRLYRLTGMF